MWWNPVRSSPIASGNSNGSPGTPSTNRRPRISPRASSRRKQRNRWRHGGSQSASRTIGRQNTTPWRLSSERVAPGLNCRPGFDLPRSWGREGGREPRPHGRVEMIERGRQRGIDTDGSGRSRHLQGRRSALQLWTAGHYPTPSPWCLRAQSLFAPRILWRVLFNAPGAGAAAPTMPPAVARVGA